MMLWHAKDLWEMFFHANHIRLLKYIGSLLSRKVTHIHLYIHILHKQ